MQSNPAAALNYTNLYSRLLALPVLNHKWAILSLLYQLSDSPDPSEYATASPLRPSHERELRRRLQMRDRSARASPVASRTELDSFDDSLSHRGLRRLPPRVEKRSSAEGSTTARDSATSFAPKDVAIKSKFLADNFAPVDPAEPVLLRDLPFTLQGVSSSTLAFPSPDRLRLPSTLPPPIIHLLHTLAEPALLYRGLDAFVKSATPKSLPTGLLGQSLRAAIGSELRAYLTLVATLESQIRHALSTLDQSSPRGGIGKAGVTLKRCVIWTREATMGLRLLSLIAEESKSMCSTSKSGPQVLGICNN